MGRAGHGPVRRNGAVSRGPTLRDFLEALPEAALLCRDGRIVAVNRRARDLFGRGRRLRGRRIHRLLGILPEPGGACVLTELALGPEHGIEVEVRRNLLLAADDPAELVLLREVGRERALARELREVSDRLGDVATLAYDWFWETDVEHHYVWFSENIERVLGIPRGWFYGKRRHDILGPDNDPAALAAHFVRLERHEPYRDFEFQIRGPDRCVWVRSNGKPLFDERGRFRGYRGTGRDITAFKEAERARRESEERYRRLVELLPDGMVLHRGGVIVFANHQLAELLGWSTADTLVGRHVLDFVHPEDRARVVERWRQMGETGKVPPAELRLVRRDGAIVHVETRAATVACGEGRAVLVTARDIGERKLAEERLAWLAHHDTLTGLPNRRLLMARVAERVREGTPCALLLLDLEGFKRINDTLGHAVGDRLLTAFAERLRAQVRPDDTVARLGGDEFAVLACGVRTVEEALGLARRIRRALETGFEVGGGHLRIGAAVGLALHPRHAPSADELLAHADLALYAAVRQGPGEPVVFRDTLLREAEEEHRIERELRGHLEEGRLEVHYQPTVRLVDRQPVGVEALVRWPGPATRRVPPDRFVAVAERWGLSSALTDFVLRRAAADLPCLEAALGRRLRLAVNLAPAELAVPRAAERMLGRLDELGLDPGRLEFEITERTLLEDVEVVADNLARLARRGVRFAVDDFGTGYSSLVYLKRFPFDRLKLDRAFVRGLPDDEENRAIVAAVLSLARQLGLEVLAEGVETVAQYEHLRRLGCGEAQGYLFAPPLAPDDFVRHFGGEPRSASRRPSDGRAAVAVRTG